MKGWASIETAPKDGRWVVLGIVGRNEVLLAYWHRLHGEWWGQSGSTGEWKKWQKATHWRPMFDPPEIAHADD